MSEFVADRMQKIISLAKRRGFIFQSSEIYGGLKSTYDYGPLGVELKRNIANYWWRCMVHTREDIVGLDAAILMHPKVWETSGHLSGFSDPLMDCYHCKERFRADHAPQAQPKSTISWGKPAREGLVRDHGVLCPVCGSPEVSDERPFNLMFRTHLGAVDLEERIVKAVDAVAASSLSSTALRQAVRAALTEESVYLRPETAQAMFVQFTNVQQSMGLKIPFGIAQIGKSFRNEITVEHFIFRSCEFEQMELEYFVEPGTEAEYLEKWHQQRLDFWRRLANYPEHFRSRPHTPEELAHYASACYDIEYAYPWGYGELEGIACRGNYDLSNHQAASGKSLQYFDPQKPNPETQTPGWRYTPSVIEPAAGLTRAVLVFLLDAYHEEAVTAADGTSQTRTVLKLHPQLAPIKVAVLPLLKKMGLPECARQIVSECWRAGLNASYDENHAIGRRYRRHDEIGTPYCLTVDPQSLQDKTVTIRHRDTMQQERLPIEAAVATVQAYLDKASSAY
jgi:glycyl-tRNA synthetase